MASTRTVSGDVVLPAGNYTVAPALVLVQVEDISRADAPAVVIGEFRQRKTDLKGGDAIPFTVAVQDAAVDERHLYSVRAHVNVGDEGSVKRGDFVSTRTYPVLTRGSSNTVRVLVQQV